MERQNPSSPARERASRGVLIGGGGGIRILILGVGGAVQGLSSPTLRAPRGQEDGPHVLGARLSADGITAIAG